MKLVYSILATLFITTFVLAENPAVWENITYEDFAKGTVEGTVLFSDGTIQLGDRLKSFDTPEATLWSSAIDEQGVLYLGTGHAGVVYRMSSAGLQKYCETGELIVTSLAAKGDILYAGTIPNGKIFRIKDGQASMIAELPCKYIWAIVVHQEKIYAATGDAGKLYEVDIASSQNRVLVKTPEQHILSLVMDSKHNLYLGSAPGGILFQATLDGKLSVLVDLPENEIRALAVANDKIYIGANETKKFDNTGMVKGLAQKVQQQTKGKALDRRKLLEEMLSGSVYQYTATRGWEKLLDLPKNFVTCLTPLGNNVLVGTGLQGLVYDVHDMEMWSIIHDLKEDQIMSLVATGSKLLYFITGDTAAVYQIESEFLNNRASYTSAVFDGQSFTKWSTLYWDAQGELGIQTRTGNTEEPDDFWSDWSYLTPSSQPYFRIKSSAGRYFQYRVVWQHPEAILKSVRVIYTRQNRSPVLKNVKMEISSDNPRNLYLEKPNNPIKISWKGEEPDKETLRYRLWYKHFQSNYWQEMTAGQVLTATNFKWETQNIPDGYYDVKLVASDELENTTPTSSTYMFRPVLIDNRPPSITARMRDNEITGTVVDSFSIIVQIGYRINEGEWVLIDPQDGLCDHLTETFLFALPQSPLPSYTLQIKALDAAGNIGYTFCQVNATK